MLGSQQTYHTILKKSISGNFDTDGATIGTTSGNEIAITIGDMLGMLTKQT